MHLVEHKKEPLFLTYYFHKLDSKRIENFCVLSNGFYLGHSVVFELGMSSEPIYFGSERMQTLIKDIFYVDKDELEASKKLIEIKSYKEFNHKWSMYLLAASSKFNHENDRVFGELHEL
jgi:hypothetical protein